MSVNTNTNIIAGVRLSELFTKIEFEKDTYAEYNNRGKKTGKTLTDTLIYATFPNGDRHRIGKQITDSYKRIKNRYSELYEIFEDVVDVALERRLELSYDPWSGIDDSELNDIVLGVDVYGMDEDGIQQIDLKKFNDIGKEVLPFLQEQYGYEGNYHFYYVQTTC